ncbi:HAD hydrolase-like protein [Prosthecobacter sp.]|uniref:HAD hydrolase-like protein n=1 Tax=Prosthecobacter sp. TaxID=1965333 RepID=UPI00378511F2
MPPPIRAVIFDFDGLIVDTESTGYHTWREIFSRRWAPTSSPAPMIPSVTLSSSRVAILTG